MCVCVCACARACVGGWRWVVLSSRVLDLSGVEENCKIDSSEFEVSGLGVQVKGIGLECSGLWWLQLHGAPAAPSNTMGLVYHVLPSLAL